MSTSSWDTNGTPESAVGAARTKNRSLRLCPARRHKHAYDPKGIGPIRSWPKDADGVRDRQPAPQTRAAGLRLFLPNHRRFTPTSKWVGKGMPPQPSLGRIRANRSSSQWARLLTGFRSCHSPWIPEQNGQASRSPFSSIIRTLARQRLGNRQTKSRGLSPRKAQMVRCQKGHGQER